MTTSHSRVCDGQEPGDVSFVGVQDDSYNFSILCSKIQLFIVKLIQRVPEVQTVNGLEYINN